jgi:aspartyl-tRNA(Asn)/glutamyl-tRNA(Gln) amidotransferase subunit C
MVQVGRAEEAVDTLCGAGKSMNETRQGSPALSFPPVYDRKDPSQKLFPPMENQMKITGAEVKHVARLARLKLSEEEVETFTGQMGAILAYIEKLNELDTDGIVPTAHAVPMENAFREDMERPSIGVEQALANAPERVDGFFRVPKVIE